jgi:hypothetical protein
MRLLQVLEEIYFPKARNVQSKSTRTHYYCALRMLGEYLQRPPELSDLVEDTVEDWLTWCIHSNRWSMYTIKQRRGYLVALWNWLARRRMVDTFPDISPIRPPEIIPEAWTETELRLLMRHCERQTGYHCEVPQSMWWPSIHSFWYYEGERLSATLSARWDHLHDGVLVIPADDRKGKRKPAVYHLHPDVLSWLDKLREPERELIWPYPRSLSMFWKRYRKLIETAGLAWKPRTGPQKMRRTHATMVEKYGGNATLSLMHSSSSVTQRHYIDPRIAHPTPENRKLPRIA